MFGDDESVTNSSMLSHAKLHKRHSALSFHRVREAKAAGIVNFYHITSKDNPADILSKHRGYQQVWQLLRTYLVLTGRYCHTLRCECTNLTSRPSTRKWLERKSLYVGSTNLYHRCSCVWGVTRKAQV